MADATLLEVILRDDQKERAHGVGDFLFVAENYARSVSLALNGFSTGFVSDEPAFRNLYAIRKQIDDLAAWLQQHQDALAQYVLPKDVFEQTRKDLH